MTSDRVRVRALRTSRASLLVAVLMPAVAVAQQAVGEITLVYGRATVTRGAQLSSAALQFRDHLLLGDRITLAEHSRVKILLFGKSVLTIHELSALTIIAGVPRPTLFLDQGKIDYAVPRDRMQPSEVHEIRTPNAFARVHGTVMTVEIERRSAEMDSAPIGTLTNICTRVGSVLAGTVGSPPVRLGQDRCITISGNVLGPIRPAPKN